MGGVSKELRRSTYTHPLTNTSFLRQGQSSQLAQLTMHKGGARYTLPAGRVAVWMFIGWGTTAIRLLSTGTTYDCWAIITIATPVRKYEY
jgi:hypothetical protein